MTFSFSHASGIADLPAPLVVCCHDAGAANLLAAWVAAAPACEVRISTQGPAQRIFSSLEPPRSSELLPAALAEGACLLSGSGWGSDFEHEARLMASQRGIASLAVLDHWVNYRARFVRGDLEVLPDAFVVTDAAAAQLARECFGDARPILQWHNDYLQAEAARVRALAPRPPAAPAQRLLVALEPLREEWDREARVAPEFRALDYLMANLAALNPRPEELLIRLRPHPSESVAKYQDWAAGQRHRLLELSRGEPLAADLAWADAVAGLHSYALVVALAAGRRAVSYLPPGAPPCALRVAGIELLRELAGGHA